MQLKQLWLSCVLLIVAAGCQPASLEADAFPTNTPTPLEIASTAMPLSQASTEHPATNSSSSIREGIQLPVFLEVIQTTAMGERGVQSLKTGVGPTIYFYDPDHKVLMLNPKIILESATELLIGVTQVLQTPDQVYENREIIQYPPAQPVSVQVETLDLASDTLTISFAGETFDLAPGEKRSFKQLDVGPNRSTNITTISNYGRLAEIQPLSQDGSLR